MQSMISIDEVVGRTKLLPLLSQSSMRLMEIIKDDRHTLADIIRIVSLDAPLTARLLMVVNAPAFSQSGQVNSLSRAVAVLGEKVVTGIALAMCAPFIYENDLSGYAGERGLLWKHCMRAAIASREVSRYGAREINPDVAFTSGILHDIGKAVISEYLSDMTGLLLEEVQTQKAADFLDAERQALGFDHTVLGEAVARHWQLPAPYPQVVRFHHEPMLAPEAFRHEVFCAHLGDLIAMMGGTGTGADTLLYRLDEHFEEYFDFPPLWLEATLLTVSDEYEKTKAAFYGE
ncbi:MAG: HDOD domain-containing protein [Desulfovibrionaceae bacterium]|nr:HDOD domain-containing protein [Desulfovibrionaceae bacterium]MBF0513204.1 HDOD domain-containing protein [Desulfovibrionaceae bacterium]